MKVWTNHAVVSLNEPGTNELNHEKIP